MDINKVSHVSSYQTPKFIESEYPLFNKFIEYYYKSQEKTGLGQNILNNFLNYLDIDRLNVDILDGATVVVESISAETDTIVVESVDSFLTNNGSIMIGDEVIFYENTVSAPNIALSPGITYDQVKLKWITLVNPLNDFDGVRTVFPLISQDNPIGPPSDQHLIVKLFGNSLVPSVDYTVSGTNIVFTTAPRAKLPSDDTTSTSITYQNGFVENTIVAIDDISSSFGDGKKEFKLTRNGEKYDPIVAEYVLAVYDNRLLVPKVDFYLDKDLFIFEVAPLNGRSLSLFSIEAPIPSFGSGAVGYSRVSDTGSITAVTANKNGRNYRFEYPPKVTINSEEGSSASVKALVNGIKSVSLLDGGSGYSDTNPPTVTLETPTKTGALAPTMSATVTNGSVTAINIDSSGSGYTFTPRITFKQPGGATLATPTIVNGSISGAVTVTATGQGYTTPPKIYIDEPTGTDGIKASLRAVLTDGQVTSITVLNAGQGYENVPRIAVIDPVGAQILETTVDADGRVIAIELLSGGSGYVDVPSVYIVDNRINDIGAYIGGTGATAVASVFNGAITDINITSFGTGYSPSNPPKIVIQAPPEAQASAEIGLNEVTGFSVLKGGAGYSKAAFKGCARAASGITGYTEDGNVIFSNNTTAKEATVNTQVKCLDAVFVKRLLDKYTEQFLPDVPSLDYSRIDVRSSIKTIKDFYSAKGTSFSIGYLFKLLYGETVTVSYPKDQITKPSAATWSIDTILRATLVSGNPVNIKDGLLLQEEDIADPNIKQASALIENFISIQTSEDVIYELALSEETITGTFTVPYKTRLAEPLNTTESIITVDSTIGWPERNGTFKVGTGTGAETIQYKEKSLNQFIECTRSLNGVVEDWDSATEVSSNFVVYINKGTPQEVVMSIVGIVDAQQTTLTNTGSYYLPGDKLTVSKLGGTGTGPELTTWLYNVKKLVEVETITFGGVNNRSATVTCRNPHGLLVGDQVTVYGANPIIYNGSFLVTSRDSSTTFQYQLPQPATVIPQGNILVSVDLNKGKSDNSAVSNAIGPYTTNVQNTFFNTSQVYVASTGIPNYNIGPFPGSALLPGNQRKLNRFPIVPSTISTKNLISPGPIGTWVNGVSIWSYKSKITKTFGAVTSVTIDNAGKGYDAAFPPAITVSGGGGTGAAASVVVNGSLSEITVTNGGTGYTSSPLVSIVGGGGAGASATAIITKGVVSRILINDGGTGYTSQPSITIVGGGGSGATGTASVRGPIKSVSISAGGESYTSNPTVTLSSGQGAVAQAIVNDGRIISIAIIAAGFGYTTAPEVTIQGDGFGAVARATIDVDGENAGRVTGITIINKGIGYTQGTTVINLNSVGQDAKFTANVFQWTYNLQETSTFDSAKGAVFEGYNNQYGGEYAHLSNPQRLRYILGDNLFENNLGEVLEQDDQLAHSPIIGWAFDGNPIYGPYGYQDATDQGSSITRLLTSYRLKANLVYDEVTNPTPVRTAGPLLSAEAAGRFIDDYEYSFGLGDLDQYNGRFCKTPEFPNGRYCYFVTIDATEQGNPVYPYILGPSFNSIVDRWNLSDSSIQQNIPTGVVRYRDPYENVDIDVERAPNASTNALTLENGDLLLFEVEDENRDGVITQDELDDPDQIFEESPLQLFDYFPTVKLDSKVDIEVETITKFEDASITGFVVENAGQSYQVDDQLIFDNTGTGGSGASARVSRIKGETVSSYTFENIGGDNYGVLKTLVPHNLVAGDSVFVDYTPVMDNTNKEFKVRQFKGIEQIVINQTGSGYNTDIPPTIIIDGDGDSGDLEAVVTSVGSIDTVNILNSGANYTKNPRVILSHPQVFKKAEYIVSLIESAEDLTVNDIFVNEDKEIFVCGRTLDNLGNNVGFVSKLSTTGVKEWEKTLELQSGRQYAEFQKIYVDGNNIWVAGINKPNTLLLDTYNPDIILVKYVQADNGLSATLNFQKSYSGISGSSRSDNVTALTKYSDTRFVIGGYTNTNSANPYDAFIALIDTSGNFAIKRKLASTNDSEKITDIVVDGTDLYFSLETADTISTNNINASFGKAVVGTTAITVSWIKEYSQTGYSFLNTSLAIDEFKEFYITSTLRAKSDNTTRDSVWVGKVDTDGNFLWNYRYVAPGRDVNCVGKSAIDIFGDLNIAFNRTDNTTGLKTVDTVKIGYDGKIKNHTTNEFNKNRIEGITANSIAVDKSGDVYVFGQTQWNRNEFLFEFATDATDTIGNYTPTLVGNDATESLTIVGDGIAKIFGRDIATPANWENAYIELPSSTLGAKLGANWTLEFMLYHDAANSDTHSQTQQTLVSIGDASDTTGGLWMYYDRVSGYLELAVTNNTTAVNSATSPAQSTLTTMFADNTWQFIGLKKEGNVFTMYVNGSSVATATVADTQLISKPMRIGQIAGRNGTLGTFRSNEQGQYYVDNLRLRNRAVTPTVPSDVQNLPSTGDFGLAFSWTDTAFFTTYSQVRDYIDYVGWGLKVDKNADAVRLGDKGVQTETQVGFVRTAVSPVTGVSLTMGSTGFDLGTAGLQALDFDDATTTMTETTGATLTYSKDIWSSRTATVPSPGSQKLKVTAVVKDRYYFKVADTVKIDNVQELTINQSFRFTVGSKLVLRNGASFVNSGYITRVDNDTNKVYLAVNNNSWSNDLNTGELSTEQFNEQSTYGIVGPIPNDINQIDSFSFAEIVNTTPGTFDIDLNDFNLDGTASVGTGNLDSFAKFKPYTDDDYSVRIDEVSGSSAFIVGSVITLDGNNVSYNAAYSTINITGLTGVLKITLITNLTKILQVTARANSDEVYVITSTRNYLRAGDMLYVDGNPSQEIGEVVYDEYDGSFPVDRIISPLEFVYKLPQAAVTDPATSASAVSIFIKSPVLKMYYGHQYLFDLSHSSMLGGNLSFAKDNLYKLEYSFNSIERVGTPGVTGEGQPTPTVKFKVEEDIVTNISYYFDPSRVDADDSPIIQGSYLDIVGSPYRGTFEVSSVSGETITRGPDILKFPLLDEPEGNADVSKASYSTSSKKAVGSISNIRIVNSGGFYTKLPIIQTIRSTRQIERVEINEPGTEYAVGTYSGVPISGNGEGGLVSVTVADGTDSEGAPIPGQVQNVTVTSPGKGYTTATVDIDAIDGILGAGLTGSGAEVTVVIPASGSGASIFPTGDSIGKIKKLKNNNFGYDYPHDYTLRPEITFPINAQLTSTSILDSITVTDPGSGYSQAPAVVITGGGGSGAIAESSIKNGRLDKIEVKDPGAGYSSTPTVQLKSSFNYVINLDLGLLQFSFPHGIANGAEISLNVVDTGDGAAFPIAAGAVGRLNGNTTYYAIAGSANSLEDDQLKIAITSANAELGDALTFTNAGTGRQQVQTTSFGGAATANVITSTFLEGELVYQGDSLENATATGFVSTNEGWQVGPRIIKIVDYTGDFGSGEKVTGVISKSSGTISSLNIAKGVLDVGSITKTTGQFIDDVGKPSEIIQKIQDSYYYQDFSYAIKSAVSISEWKDILIKNVHPASFKVFGELNLNEYGFVPNKETSFELTKSVELAREATVPNIQSFALVEPVYTAFNNTEVLFRQKRLTSSENILTSTVQRLDDISNLFDGQRIAFPLQVDGTNVVASADQMMVILNGVVQTPNTAFEIQGESIVFNEPPQPPASVKYVNVEIAQIQTYEFTFSNQSGIFPIVGMTLVGTQSTSRLTVTSVVGDSIFGFITQGNVGIVNTLDGSSLTGGAGYTDGTYTNQATTSSGAGSGLTLNYTVVSGAVTSVTIGNNSGVAYVNNETITIPGGTTSATIDVLQASGFAVAELTTVGATGFAANLADITPVTNLGLFNFSETISNLEGNTAVVEEVNLETGENTPIAELRYTIGAGTTSIEVVDPAQENDTFVAASEFTIGANYQLGAEIITLQGVTVGTDSTVLNVQRGQLSTTAISHQEDQPLYGTDLEITDKLALSKTVGTYQSKPGLFDIQLDDVIIGASSGVVARVTATSAYQDPVTNEFIEQVNISEGSSFFGLLFNRLTSSSYPNIVLDDISKSQVNIVDFTDNSSDFDSKFPGTEFINNYVISYDNLTGTFQSDEKIRNYKIGYGNLTNNFQNSEDMVVRKVTFDDKQGTGFLAVGQVIRTTDTKGEVIGYNQARGTVFIGKIGRCQSTGDDIFDITFNGDAQLDTAQYKYGTSSLLLDGAGDYLNIASSSEFAFGTGAFTYDVYVRPATDALTGTSYILDQRSGSSGDTAAALYLENGQVRFSVAGSDVVTSGLLSLTANTWQHIAVVRSSTGAAGIKLYIDGVERGSATDATTYTAKPLNIGSDWNATNAFEGHIDELRVSNTNRYTAAFTALTGMFQGDANAKLLVHFDGVDAATYTEDWSGAESFTNNEEFNNDVIAATWRANSANLPTGFAGKTHRYYDAANLIESNKNFIAKEAVHLLTVQYPSLVIPGGNVNCEDDVRDILSALVEDLRNGSNNHMWDASALYVDRTNTPVTLNHIETEVVESVWTYDKVKEMLQYIINNVLWTVAGSHGLTQSTDATITDSSYTSLTTFSPSTATYNAATGDLVLTIGTHSLTTASRVTLTTESITFTCDDDNNDREISYPRKTDPAANAVLAVTAVDATTITVNVGASPAGQQYTHTFVSALSSSVTELNYTTGDCADVWSTVGNLMDILTDTLEQANLGTPVDHLGTITKVEPAYEFMGGTVDAFLETPFTTTYHNANDDVLYTNKIDLDSRYRFRDAANLIDANTSVIVDKAAADMLSRYPDLATEMPRNAGDSTDGTLRCKTDMALIVGAMSKDIRNGGNFFSVEAARFYLGTSNELQHIRLQVWQSVYAHDRLGFYMKQAINGDLTYDNTDDIIVGDWGITNDPGGCANVKSAIDTLITTINDIIAPTDEDFNIAGDRLYFNRQYIAEEITGITNEYLRFNIDGANYQAYTYDTAKCQRDIKYLIVAIISDLQTGGNNSTVANMEKYLNANGTLNYIEEELLPTVYAFEQIRTLGEKAIRNLLYSSGSSITGDQYAAVYTSQSAYRDLETPTDIDQAVYRLRDLVDIVIEGLSPGGNKIRNAAKNFRFNSRYYDGEIGQRVNNQFGSNSWVYSDFISDVVNNITTDSITTNIGDVQDGYVISLANISSTDFEVGETVTSSGGGTATILEFDKKDQTIYVGTMSTLFVQNDTLTGGTSGATATVATGNGSWYFDGVNDSVRVNTGVTLGTDSFTLECWVRRDDANTSFYASGSNANNFNFYLGAGTSNVGFWGGNSANWININQLNGVTTSPNTWIHMAFVRDTAQNGDDCSIYLNGILQGTGTMTTNYNLTQFVVGAPYVGYSGSNTADGYISDWRVSSTAVYQRGTSTVGDTVFSTPTRAFIASDVTETEVLLCQGSPIEDNGPNSFNLTTYGGGPVGTGTSPFGFFPGVSSAFDWYNSPTNVKILAQARQIQSPISGQTSSPNLYTFPENLGYNSFANTSWYSNVQTAPDGTQTADKLFGVGGGTHFMYRGYNLTAYETFDSTGRRFDSTNETFDTGYPGISEQQQFTLSAFFKKAELGSLNFKFAMDSQTKNINFNVDLFTGQIAEASVFVSPGITLDDYGVTPVGDDWFRVHATASFGFGIANVYLDFGLYNRANINATYGQGFYVWGIKLNSGALDPYTANSGQLFYSNAEYNIKTYALGLLQQFMIQSLTNELISPSTAATISSFYQDPNGSDALTDGVYSETSVSRLIRLGVSTITKQLADDTHYTGITQINGVGFVDKTYGDRDLPVGISGGLNQADYFYGLDSDAHAELSSSTLNEGKIVKVYKRFRIDGEITDGPFTMNETVAKQGAPSITGVVYGFHEDENFKYLDVEVTAGPWAVTDTIVGGANSTTAQINAIEDRLHIINLQGDFVADIEFLGYTSGATAQPTSFLKTEASVTSNEGGTLTVDTESLLGVFEKNAVVYPASSEKYIEVRQYAGLEISVGDRIASDGYLRLGISVLNAANQFRVGNRLYRVINNIQQPDQYAIITEVDLNNNYLYVSMAQGVDFAINDNVGDYGTASFPEGFARVTTTVTTPGAASALVQDVRPAGLNKRLYLTDIAGTFTSRDAIKGRDAYKAVIDAIVDLKARVKRAFKGFDGTTTTFDLTIANGTSYLPDPEGHLLIFVNGILQPPGGTNAFTAFSNRIQFTEAPELGSSFTGFYVGKLRQLDDISFEFDSLRQSFNLKRNEVFYSLTLTDGVQSSVIRPENNIIVSLNGVVQEPGVGFEIVGSRIIFSEIPRVGSTFVAFSYVGSEADVDAAEVVPPIEPGDFIDIQGETTDREVAVIESSNSLITFDYLGSIFGQGAVGNANLTSGFIDSVQVTSGGSGYTSRPTVRIDSISGFDGNIRALVGIANIEINNVGSGYANPEILVETSVPDDWTAPNLALYGEEVIDPEIA
ncbi:hypothetical protein Np151112_088 [Synechococcus phage S-RIM2]|uniref:YHYH domain-containing protein n=1 Tax=Synechococcus phage S-RIM2 TaxID=687800 RepID=A0A1D7RKZ2_9CAUD|nr:hypothetical protein Np151112_088 [Synechococcus phage S-RIM2]